MIHFFRTLRKQLISEKKFSKYVLYALGEVFLVVVGILIALQINNWNNYRIERKEEAKTYRNIRQQIVTDSIELHEMRGFNRLNTRQCEMANDIIAERRIQATDTLAYLTMMLSQYSDFRGRGNIFETLVNSGDVKLLKNEEIPRRIKGLENTYNYINKLEQVHWDLILEELPKELRGVINYSTGKALKPERLYSVELQNIFVEINYLTQGKDSIYSRALREINILVNLIDDELEIDPVINP